MKHQTQSSLEEKTNNGNQSRRRELLCVRDGKSIYQSDSPEFLIQMFGSNVAITDEEASSLKPVDALRNKISSYIFEYLEGFHIPTHFVSNFSEVEMLIKRAEIIPLTVRVFNSVNGNLMKRLNVKDVMQTDFPIIEHFFNNGTRNNSWVNEYHIYALGIATPEELKQINRIASKTNAVLRGLCDRRNLTITDINLEFGRFKNQLILIDEISPFTCHFSDVPNGTKVRKDKYSIDQENAGEMLMELSERLMLKT